VVDRGRSSLRHSSMKPSNLDETSVFQNSQLLLESTGIHSKTTCASTRLHGNRSQQFQTCHSIQLSGGTRTNAQTQESVTCVGISSNRAYGFSVHGSSPPSVVWMMLQRLSSATRLSNDVNINLHDPMHYGTLTVTINLGHGVL